METASCVLQSPQWDHEATFPCPVPEAAVESRSQIHLTFIAMHVASWTLRVIFSVGLPCCPRTICLRVFPLLTLSKICLGNKGGCVSRLQSGPGAARALGLVIVASQRDFTGHTSKTFDLSLLKVSTGFSMSFASLYIFKVSLSVSATKKSAESLRVVFELKDTWQEHVKKCWVLMCYQHSAAPPQTEPGQPTMKTPWYVNFIIICHEYSGIHLFL